MSLFRKPTRKRQSSRALTGVPATKGDLAAFESKWRHVAIGLAILVVTMIVIGVGFSAYYARQITDNREAIRDAKDKVNAEQDANRDESFHLLCTVFQSNATDFAAFAHSIDVLIPPRDPVTGLVQPPTLQLVDRTARRLAARQYAFAKAKCDDRADLQRLIETRGTP